jgi:hypothetical protein
VKFLLEKATQEDNVWVMNLAQIAREAESLSELEKTLLANTLLDQLHSPIDPEIERAQIAFAEERLAAYERGEDKAIPADEMLVRLRKKYLP